MTTTTSNQEPAYRIENGWIVEAVDECTCGAGTFLHEPGCGLIPVVPLERALMAVATVDGFLLGQTEEGDLSAVASTPGEFAARWNRRSVEDRQRYIDQTVEAAGIADACVDGDHAGRLLVGPQVMSRAWYEVAFTSPPVVTPPDSILYRAETLLEAFARENDSDDTPERHPVRVITLVQERSSITRTVVLS